MDELHMVRELLPQAPPPTMEVTAAARARLFSGEASVPRSERSARGHRRPRWRWYGLGLPFVAGAAAVLVLLATSGQPASTGHPAGGRLRSSPATGKANVPSAQAVLLAAATSAAKQAPPAMGKYWRVATTSMRILVAGTKAHPYDLADLTRGDDAWARVAGQPFKLVSQDLGAKPATSRDAAAWRANGSPTQDTTLFIVRKGMVRSVGFSYAPSAPDVYQEPSHGEVAFAVGDGSPLTTTQLAAFPSDPAKLKAQMIRYVNFDYRGGPPAGSMDENLMTEAINLLQDPLPPAVESAVYQVMAGLPGSRTLGLMRDPLGRSGYGIAYAGQYSLPRLPQGVRVQPVLIVDPSSGKLLATEAFVTTPGTGIVRDSPLAVVPAPGGRRGPGLRCQGNLIRICVVPLTYGTRHQGQLWAYTVIKVAAWTNTLPPS